MFEGPPKTKKDKETVGRREGRRNPLLSLWSTGSKQLRKWVDVRRGLREQMISHLHTKPIRNILRSSWPSLSSLAVFCLTDQQQNQPSGSGHLPELVASLCAVSRGVLYCCDSEAMCRQLHLILPPLPYSHLTDYPVWSTTKMLLGGLFALFSSQNASRLISTIHLPIKRTV